MIAEGGFSKGLFALPAPLLVSLLLTAEARGRVYDITDTNDTTEITSLRGAVIDANARGGENIILLGREPDRGINQQRRQWTYRLTIPGADEDACRTGDLDVTRGSLTIIGAGPSVNIDATGLGDRVFHVLPGARLTLERLRVTGGVSVAGGAIYDAGRVTLRECVVVGNSSYGAGGWSAGGGGGIYSAGDLAMYDCLIAKNNAGDGSAFIGGDGGGIYNAGGAIAVGCVISSNAGGAGGAPDEPCPGGNGGSGGNGGGIYNSGTMDLEECAISHNLGGQGHVGDAPLAASDSWEPYLQRQAGQGGVIDCILPGRGGEGGAGGGGAGIYNKGKLRLRFCTVSGNSCGDGGGGGTFGAGGDGGAGGSGGGIFNAADLSLDTCTVSGNSCGSGGAGGVGELLLGVGDGGAGGGGGGIFSAGAFEANSCTVTLNVAGAGGNGGNKYLSGHLIVAASAGGPGGQGGGVLNQAGSIVFLRNTLVALGLVQPGGLGGTNFVQFTDELLNIGDNGAAGSGPDLAGDFRSHGFNLIGVGDGCAGLLDGVSADHVGSVASPIDPLLGPLQENGGPTLTHALLPGSPAIDQGNDFGIRRDQRGERRPYDYRFIPNAPGGDGSDIGAFESNPPGFK